MREEGGTSSTVPLKRVKALSADDCFFVLAGDKGNSQKDTKERRKEIKEGGKERYQGRKEGRKEGWKKGRKEIKEGTRVWSEDKQSGTCLDTQRHGR